MDDGPERGRLFFFASEIPKVPPGYADAFPLDTYLFPRTIHRSGQSADLVMPMRAVTSTLASGIAWPSRITSGFRCSDLPVIAPVMPSAVQSFPGPLVRSTSLLMRGRRLCISDKPSNGSTARTSTALGDPSSRVTALKHQYMP